MSRNRLLLVFCWLLLIMVSGCSENSLVDSNKSMPDRTWNYANKVRVVVEIKDPAKPVDIYFKLRITNDYRYSNIFILFHTSGAALKKQTRRYEYRLAEPDGQWLGSGSGNLYTYTLPLLTRYKFPRAGKYALEVEQNMRDNPLLEISDAGLSVEIEEN